jgi:hypothetical protein
VARSPGWAGLQWLILGRLLRWPFPGLEDTRRGYRASARKKELGSEVYKRRNTCNRPCAPSPLKAVCAENSESDVLVMQTADQGMRHDASDPLN